MRRLIGISGMLFVLCAAAAAEGQVFRYNHNTGDKFRIVSEVEEDVYINGLFSHSAEILNRISVKVVDAGDDWGELEAHFQTSERAFGSGGAYEWGREYESFFLRDSRGVYDIAPEYFMPVVRDVPVFPREGMVPGERWTFPASEVHDLRDNLGVPEAFHIPLQVNYTYEGPEEVQGQLLHRILIEYTVFHRPELPREQTISPYHPVRISGFSRQVLYWNSREGRPETYSEEFNIFFDLYSGDSVEYRGTAGAKVVEAVLMNKEAMADDLRRVLDEKGMEDTDVRVDPEGVTISLRNIQFPPDSAFLRNSEKLKLDEIAGILAEYSDRDVVISGHTALAGTAEGRQKLSEDRARAVGNYLLSTGTRKPQEMVIRGYGAEKPLADNSTPEGMVLNRRVEIMLLEN